MKKKLQPGAVRKKSSGRPDEELRIAAKILEWEIGDIWGHVGVRLPDNDGIAVQMFRRPEKGEQSWLVRFDYSLNKLSGVGTIPRESTIYTEIFKARPDVNAVVHSHAPMCIALGLADKQLACVHMQSFRFGGGVPVYPRPIYILDDAEGAELARALDGASAVMIKGHGIVTVGRTIDEASMTALYMERTAKIQAMAHLLGFKGPTEEFIEELTASKDKLFANMNRIKMTHSAEWKYYSDKIKKKEKWTRGWS
ncbi:MAG TPA: class II aldolase/adducin family protein [Verrucomicrobiae bacterium]|jgi:3,4-dihydroxyphthalate decarboxylase|nr:class II aldolase/adducin family protein [Verrucomicrobiae bacterium]